MTEHIELQPGQKCPTCGQTARRKKGLGFLLIMMLLGGMLGCAGGFYFVKWWFGPDNYFYGMGIIHETLFSVIGLVIGAVVGQALRK